jgi:hypothetical protein
MWGSGFIDPQFLDFGTSWGWVVSYTPLPLYPGERAPGTHFIGGWVGPRAGLDDMEENSWPYQDSNSHPSVVQPVASHYIDYAIPALGWYLSFSKHARWSVHEYKIRSLTYGWLSCVCCDCRRVVGFLKEWNCEKTSAYPLVVWGTFCPPSPLISSFINHWGKYMKFEVFRAVKI